MNLAYFTLAGLRLLCTCMYTRSCLCVPDGPCLFHCCRVEDKSEEEKETERQQIKETLRDAFKEGKAKVRG